MSSAIARESITGLVLAGGQGRRMGGLDKGLQPYGGVPLALHAARRLALQVGPLAINANRHLEQYAGFGLPVWPDAQADRPGPLAGLLAGLTQATTPWLASVPCDSPRFPPDLVARLAEAAAQAHADMALALSRESDGRLQPQPVFCLLRRDLRDDLELALAAGQRGIERWAAGQQAVRVVFDDPGEFANANTLAELQALQPT